MHSLVFKVDILPTKRVGQSGLKTLVFNDLWKGICNGDIVPIPKIATNEEAIIPVLGSAMHEEATILVPIIAMEEKAIVPILEIAMDEGPTLPILTTFTDEEDATLLGAFGLLSVDLQIKKLISFPTMKLVLGDGSGHDLYYMADLEEPYEGTFNNSWFFTHSCTSFSFEEEKQKYDETCFFYKVNRRLFF